MAAPSIVKDNNVRVGDYITFKFLKSQSYLSAEGIIVEDMVVSSSISLFEEHLFQIYVQRQYSATNELDEFMQNIEIDDEKSLDQGSKNHMEALIRGKENESVLNKNVMKNKTGNLLCFGDTIQLLHVKSGKFVTVKPNDLARDERENMKVVLSSDGSVMSWLKVMPRYKINREGEVISNSTEVLLKISERSNEFLHCADRAPPRGKLREVNSSLESPTPWRLSIFHRIEDALDTNLLLTGQLIYIRDPESQSILSPLAKPAKIDSTPNKNIINLRDSGMVPSNFSKEGATFEAPWSSEKIRMMEAETDLDDMSGTEASITSMEEFIEENGDVALRPTNEDELDTDGIWMMESKAITKGGVVKFRTDRVHFRHFNTGRYLAIRAREDAPDTFILCLEKDPNEKYTMFSINQLHSASEDLANGKAIQLKHPYYGLFLERGSYSDSQGVYSCQNSRSKGRAVSLIINRYTQNDKFTLSKPVERSFDEVVDIYAGKAIMFHLSKFVRSTVVPTTMVSELITLWPKIEPSDRSLFTIILARTMLFVRGYPILVKVNADMASVKPNHHVVRRRQNMFREQGLLELLLVMLKNLKPVSDWAFSDHVGGGKQPKGGIVELSREVLSDCLQLLYDLIKQNLVNQLYIADHLLVILTHVSTDRLAAKVAQELLSSNRELQETKIGLKEITIFADKMREVQMNSMYLQLLKTCCSCVGEGLQKNQDLVNSVVFKQYGDTLIKVKIESMNHVMEDWELASSSYQLYINPYLHENPHNQHNLRGSALISKGMPLITLSWLSRTNKYSSTKLYGKDDVSLTEIFRFYNLRKDSTGGKNTPSSGAAVENKVIIADYFVAQLQLAAEMCLGRNYNVIKDIEEVFTYEVLATMLKGGLHDMLKSAAAYVMLTLYVDRDPQSSVPLPRLTRTLTEISTTNVRELVCVDDGTVGQFGILQFLISSHLHSIRGKPFPPHTYNFMRLLKTLVEFNYYGEIEKLQETIHLLVACLKRDQSDLEENEESTGKYSSLTKLSMYSAHGSTNGTSGGAMSKKMKKHLSNRSMNSEEQNSQSDVDGREGQPKEDGSVLLGRDSSTNTLAAVNNCYNRLLSNELAESILHSLESIRAQIWMVIFVLVAIGVTVFRFVTNSQFIAFDAFEGFVFLVFVLELLFHLYFHHLVRGNFLQFFLNPFNLLDIATVFLYILIFLVPDPIYFRSVKALKLLRILSIAKSYYEQQNEDLKKRRHSKDCIQQWKEPERYSKTSDYTTSTIVKIERILCSIQKNIEDRTLAQFLKAFYLWSLDSRSNGDQVFGMIKSAIDGSSDLSVSNVQDDEIYVDLLMYSSSSLVQVTLELLMIHHSSRKILVENIGKLQLITSKEGESDYAKMGKIVTILKRDADTHEIWGRLDTPEHKKINSDMHKYLLELTESCRKRREVLAFDESHEPVKVTQNILRNLGCFKLCMKIVQLTRSIDRDDPFNEYNLNTRNLAMNCNRLLYWFILDNPANQALAFSHIQFFIDTVDSKIDSHKVITAIFHNNIELMESVPKKLISDFINLICSVGRFPQYLSLLGSIINVGEKNVIANQYEIIKLMSSPENVKKVVQYFVPVNHVEHGKKIRLMAPFLSIKDVEVSDLPSDLAYHLELMRLLSRCTVGRSGMTTIEAKVQSMYNFVDVVEAALDPNCILIGKIRLGQFLFNAMLDVETLLPALKDADCIWRFIISTQDIFAFAKDELRQIEKNGWESPSSNRQKVEFMLTCAMIINSYFEDYFDHSIFKPEIGQISFGVERVQIKESQANEIIKSLFTKIMSIYEMLSPLLAEEHYELLYNTLVTLNNSSSEQIVGTVDKIHESFLQSMIQYSTKDEDACRTYEEFLEFLQNDEKVKKYVDDQHQGFIEKIEELPWMNDPCKSDIRFEPLIEKLVAHIRGSIQVKLHGDESMKFVGSAETETGIWIIRIFRTMIENRWGMSIFERDDDGGEEQDEAVVDLLQVYNSSGMTEMCLDLISKGIHINLQSEALKLLVAMLFKEGGALEIQKSINSHLNKGGSDMFFRNVRHILHNLISWHTWNGVIILQEDDEPELPNEFILVRCLQLMCEGHYKPNQDIMREQPNNSVNYNLLDDFVLYLQSLDNIKCRTSSTAEMAVSATILEVIQGPCEGNQDYFALNTELIETLNRKIRQRPINDCDEEQEVELKKSAIDIFQGLLEGQGRKTAVYERMLSVIHIDVIQVLCKKSEDKFDPDEPSNASTGAAAEKEESEGAVALRTESLVLMQMLTDFRPELKQELGMDEDISAIVGDQVACIEVVWNAELQRRFFHVPDICHALAKSTKDKFIATVKRGSPEDKLYGLLEASREMYREILHQQLLKDFNLDKIFSRTNQDRATWGNFYIVLIINIFFTLYYKATRVDCNETDDAIAVYEEGTTDENCTQVGFEFNFAAQVVFILNILLVITSLFSLILYLIVRVPVNYRTYMEDNYGVLRSALYTALDPRALYYSTYFFVVLLGFIYHAALTFLLLDFVTKSPTSQEVLKAVYNPRKQIFMTLLLTMIIIYIFAMFQFFFFNEGEDFSDDNNAITLLNTFKFLIRYAFPEGTAENWMESTISTYRVFNDLAFFAAALLLLNILKGITIDTFVELRNELEKRMKDTTEKCFICGIEKNVFNRTLDRDAFRMHTKVDQNLWNYLYFIIYVWEQDKDDDDGLESFVRKCIDDGDLVWFPMNKAIRLAEHQEKGDVNSLKYRFRKELQVVEKMMHSRMNVFKDQLTRTIGRVEKALEFESEEVTRARTKSGLSRSNTPMGGSIASMRQSSVRSMTHSVKSGSFSVMNQPEASSRRGSTMSAANNQLRSSMSASDRNSLSKGVGPNLAQIGRNSISSQSSHSLSFFTNALDADSLGQLHMKLVSVVGLTIQPEDVPKMSVRILSDMDDAVLFPLVGMGEVKSYSDVMANSQAVQSVVASRRSRNRRSHSGFRSSFKSLRESFTQHEEKTGRLPNLSLLQFDFLDNPPTLVHQGPLPKTDLHKINVQLQVLYTENELDRPKFIGGVSIPIVELIAFADMGGVLEARFIQKEFQLNKGGMDRREAESDEMKLIELENDDEHQPKFAKENDFCYVTVSAVASHRLLQDWALLQNK